RRAAARRRRQGPALGPARGTSAARVTGSLKPRFTPPAARCTPARRNTGSGCTKSRILPAIAQEIHAKSLASALRSPRGGRGTPSRSRAHGDTTERTMIYKCLYIDTPDPAFLTVDGKYQAGFLDTETILRYARD